MILKTIGIILLLVGGAVLAGEPASGTAPASGAPAPMTVNQWVILGHSTTNGSPSTSMVYCPGVDGLLYPRIERNSMQVFKTAKAEWGNWNPPAPENLQAPTEPIGLRAYNYLRHSGERQRDDISCMMPYALGENGRRTLAGGISWGNAVCYDSKRKLIVAFPGGETAEFDPVKRRWTLVDTTVTPKGVSGGSLAYDPVNAEIVLATGTFSYEGYPRTTWVYRPAEKTWVALDLGGQELNAVRKPAEALRDRLDTLRLLLWKHIEYRATGREGVLDERALAPALLKEARALEAEAAPLATTAQAIVGKALGGGDAARKAYEAGQLKTAVPLVMAAAKHLNGLGAGISGATPEALETLYRQRVVPALDALTQACTAMAVMPGPRLNTKLVTDPKNGLIVCFGGEGAARLADTWVYHVNGRWWERRMHERHPPAGMATAAAFDPVSGSVVYVFEEPGKTPTVWTYDGAKNIWTALSIQPPAGSRLSIRYLEYDADAGMFVGVSAVVDQPVVEIKGLKLDLSTAPTLPTAPAPEISDVPGWGIGTPRDAATVAQLKQWKVEQDAWVQSLPANTWTAWPARGTGRVSPGRDWSAPVFDPIRRQFYRRGGGHNCYMGNGTDHYDLVTGRWYQGHPHHNNFWPGSAQASQRSFNLAPLATHHYKYHLFYNSMVNRLQERNVILAKPYFFQPEDVMDTKASPDVGFVSGKSGWVSLRGEPVHDYDPDLGRWALEPFLVPRIGDLVLPNVYDGRLIKAGGASISMQNREGVSKWELKVGIPRSDVADKGSGMHQQCWFFDPKRNRVIVYGGGPEWKWSLYTLDLSKADATWQQQACQSVEGETLPQPNREVVYIPKHDVFVMVRTLDKRIGEPEPVKISVLDPVKAIWKSVALTTPAGIKTRSDCVQDGLQYDPVSDICYYNSSKYGPFENNNAQCWAFRYVPQDKDK